MIPPSLAAREARISTAWAMPSPWTFSIPPVREFLERHLAGRTCIVDPMCGRSQLGHHRNDLAGGYEAEVFLSGLRDQEVRADAVIFDPPYSPRQISESYRGAGLRVTRQTTQNAALYGRIRALLADLLEPGGLALSFGWQSAGFGRSWLTDEILIVQHGGAHNDTICVAQRKP